jgi:hypothetical protein
MELRRRIFSWMIVSGFLLIPAHLSCADVLIYIGKGGSFKGTKIDDGITTKWPGIAAKTDVYLILDLDGIDEMDRQPAITRFDKTFYPENVSFDHQNRKKQIAGNSQEGIGYEVYGRSRGAGGKRTFTWLHLQRDGRVSSDGARDSGAGIGEGPASWLDIGTGRLGYYAPRLNFKIWRLDGGFSGTFATTQDGRQTKYASGVLNLDVSSTRRINQLGFNRSDAAVWLIENLFPNYTEQPPDVLE